MNQPHLPNRHRRQGHVETLISLVFTGTFMGLIMGIMIASRTDASLGMKFLISVGHMLLFGLVSCASLGAVYGGTLLCESIGKKYDFTPWITLVVGDISQPLPAPRSFFGYVFGQALLGHGLRICLWIGVFLIGVYPTSKMKEPLGDLLECNLELCIFFSLLAGSIRWTVCRLRGRPLPGSWKRSPYAFTFYLLWPVGLATYEAVANGPGWMQTPAVVLSMLVTFLLLIRWGLRLHRFVPAPQVGSALTRAARLD